MNEKHPNRKKDKHNPYTLMIVEGRYYLSFKDGRGVMQNIEIEKVLYDLFNRFELEDIDNDGCSKGKCRFTLSVKQITQATNRISEKACMIFSENGESNEPSR